MKTMKNRVQLIGNLGREPETKTFENGNCITKFSLATNEFTKKSNGESAQTTQWHNIVMWGKLAERAVKLLNKGMEVAIEGRLTYRSYEDKSGTARQVTEIVAEDFILMKSSQAAKAEVIDAEVLVEAGAEDLPF